MEITSEVSFKIYDCLQELGVPPHLLGYDYILYGVRTLLESSPIRPSMTKTLYPMIAKRFDTTSQRVERAIRHAKEKTLDNCDLDVLAKYIGNTMDKDMRFTNTHFLYSIVQYIIHH